MGADLVRRLLRAAVRAVDARRVTARALDELIAAGVPLDGCALLAWGKASVGMAEAAVARCRPRTGMVIALDPQAVPVGALWGLRLARGGHPVPADDAPATGRAALAMVERLGAGDVLLCLVSGGGSAMLELPVPGVDIAELRRPTEARMRAGDDIHALNAERTRLSRLKGGKLARAAAPARVVNVILSDVPGDDVSVVASGPTVPPRPGAPGFEHVRTVVAADNGTAQDAVVEAAAAEGLRLVRREGFVSGEARRAGAAFYADARARCAREGLDGVAWGGESTVRVTGDGRGGRNQEFVLGAADSFEGGALGSLGTDGVDGASDAAGAVLDAAVLERARQLGLVPQRHLDANDSEAFFRQAGGLLETGPTGTNAADVCLYLHRA
ncbi:MAG: glycerate kinase type-2 family protein [Myxococcota bacterium]